MTVVSDHGIVIFVFVFVIALCASTLSGITGFGGAVLMLPVLVHAYGLRDAVVVLTMTQAVGNGSRAWFGRTEIDWSVAWRFIVGAIPPAIIGSVAFAHLSLQWLSALLSVFLVLTVLYRHTRLNRARMPLTGFLPLGLVFGFLSPSSDVWGRSSLPGSWHTVWSKLPTCPPKLSGRLSCI